METQKPILDPRMAKALQGSGDILPKIPADEESIKQCKECDNGCVLKNIKGICRSGVEHMTPATNKYNK